MSKFHTRYILRLLAINCSLLDSNAWFHVCSSHLTFVFRNYWAYHNAKHTIGKVFSARIRSRKKQRKRTPNVRDIGPNAGALEFDLFSAKFSTNFDRSWPPEQLRSSFFLESTAAIFAVIAARSWSHFCVAMAMKPAAQPPQLISDRARNFRPAEISMRCPTSNVRCDVISTRISTNKVSAFSLVH